MRRPVCILAAAALALASANAAAGSTRPTSQQSPVKLTPVMRVPFPDRAYVVDLPKSVALDPGSVRVTENGTRVGDVSLTPLTSSGLSFGAVLAIDASDSMAGDPFAAAIAAARNFVNHRGHNERIGLVAFNGRTRLLQAPTVRGAALTHALSHPLPLRYGTHIYDAIDRALSLLRASKLSTGSIVLLSDGTDVGSSTSPQRAIARAKRQHVRIFTVGLRSRTYRPAALRSIAAQTGGSYVEAASPAQLAALYTTLSTRLASEYVLQYRSVAAPKSHVNVNVAVAGLGASSLSYTAPTPAGLTPFHQSRLTRFFLSTGSLFLLALLIATLTVAVAHGLLRRRRPLVVEHVTAYVQLEASTGPQEGARLIRTRTAAAMRSRRASGVLARLEHQLEIAEIRMSARTFVGLALLATVVVVVALALLSPVVAALGLMTPLAPRAFVRQRLKQVRARFAEQLPSNLQVLSSALRAGHSFSGALARVVEQAQDPSRRELRRIVNDDRLGVPVEEAILSVASRMENRDLEQVALVAELQHTTGGNVAEVLDIVVATIRDRQDVRRLLKTLTAQGRMARWILTALPIGAGLAFYVIQPDVAAPFYARTTGQIVLVLAVLAVVSGSLLIQRVLDVEV